MACREKRMDTDLMMAVWGSLRWRYDGFVGVLGGEIKLVFRWVVPPPPLLLLVGAEEQRGS